MVSVEDKKMMDLILLYSDVTSVGGGKVMIHRNNRNSPGRHQIFGEPRGMNYLLESLMEDTVAAIECGK